MYIICAFVLCFAVYLKTRGIDPKTHPVVAELVLLLLTTPLVPHSNPTPPPRTACGNTSTRSRKQKTPSSVRPHLLTSPFHPVPSVHLFSLLALAHTGKTAVDKAAANRFIKHAIAQAKESAQTPGAGASSSSGNTHIRFDADGHAPASSTPRAPPAPGKVTSKMLARAEWQRKVAAGQVASEDEDEDEDEADALEVFDDEGGADEEADEDEDAAPETVSSKAKDKGRATEGDSETDAKADLPGGKKRRRGAVDPFAGTSSG